MGVGKRVRGSIYLHRSALGEASPHDRSRVERAALATTGEWNVVRIASPEISLLEYRDFETDPFPTLQGSTLVRDDGRVVSRDYTSRSNPPILHRKELLVAEDHPRREEWAESTSDLVEAGAFNDAHRLGTRNAWNCRLRELGRAADGTMMP